MHTERLNQGDVSALQISGNLQPANRMVGVTGPLSKTNAKPVKIQLNQGFFRLQNLSVGQSQPPQGAALETLMTSSPTEE